MYCKKCGEQIVDNEKFCVSCGDEITESPVESSLKQNNKRLDKKINPIVILIVAICGICMLGIFILDDKVPIVPKGIYFGMSQTDIEKIIPEDSEVVDNAIAYFVDGKMLGSSNKNLEMMYILGFDDYGKLENIILMVRDGSYDDLSPDTYDYLNSIYGKGTYNTVYNTLTWQDDEIKIFCIPSVETFWITPVN